MTHSPGKFSGFNIVMIIDLDHLMSLNDCYLHAIGNPVVDR